MAMMSYAENHEDVLLNRLFPDKTDGFYIDVGANEPIFNSVTKHFYEKGWRGVNIEPSATEFTKLCADRPRDINLNVGLSDQEGVLTFHEAPNRTGWSTFSTDRAAGFHLHEVQTLRRQVPITTLTRICESHAPTTIDFVKIDVEGLEAAVIAGGNWREWRPRAVVVEANDPALWEPTLLDASYIFAAFDGLNRYYLRKEDADLLPRLKVPVSVLDGFTHYGYHHRIMELAGQLGDLEGIGPHGRELVRLMRRIKKNHPRFSSVASKLLMAVTRRA